MNDRGWCWTLHHLRSSGHLGGKSHHQEKELNIWRKYIRILKILNLTTCLYPSASLLILASSVDADHAANKVTRRSHTGIIIYCNLSPVLWYSKRQNTVETSTFSSEFVALRIATEMVEGLLYKLRMFGVSINDEARVFCANESVVNSSTFPESTL